MIRCAASKALEDHLLYIEIFVCRLDDKVSCLKLSNIIREHNPVHHILHLSLSQTLFGDLFLAPVADKISTLVKTGFIWVDHGHIETGSPTSHDANTGAHLTSTNHTNMLY